MFQRLARYPGVDENDFITLSVAQTELISVLEVPGEESVIGIDVE